MGYAVIVPVCSSDSNEHGETKVNVEFKLSNNGKVEHRNLSFNLREFQLFLRNLNKTADSALSAMNAIE
uniref:COMM domain-containing protein n=1 Tax=Panagrolaimus sp. JU765 TaxID=591449 RepID=A0AC34QK37_9BILA